MPIQQLRELNVEIDRTTWSGSVPAEIEALEGIQTVNLEDVLLTVAVLTRPPTVTGFHLADLWAFLRYASAFTDSQDLRLRQEWRDLDPHQKTILSDELGVGATCLLLRNALSLAELVDTKYFVRVIDPDFFELEESKIGPAKSPDYVGRRSASRVTVIECKGTQTAGYLRRALERGREQKQGFQPRAGGVVENSLVAGLFIAGWDGPPSKVRIEDPEFSELSAWLEQIEPLVVAAAFRQIWLAKMFALLGWEPEANLLALTPIRDLPLKHDELKRSLNSRLERDDLNRTIKPPVSFGRSGRTAFLPVEFSVVANRRIVGAVADAGDLIEWLASVETGEWYFEQRELARVVRLPFGFEASLRSEHLGKAS